MKHLREITLDEAAGRRLIKETKTLMRVYFGARERCIFTRKIIIVPFILKRSTLESEAE